MKQALNNNILAVRLYEDEDVLPLLKEAFESTGKSLGVVMSGAGMMQSTKLGFFKGAGEYKEHSLPEPREIVSFTGNFVNNGEKIFAHLHVSLADEDGCVLGGHLINAKIYGTGEIFILLSDMPVTREKEERTGLEGLKL
jgi:predicted DNA-binding protein with PD1-like motif